MKELSLSRASVLLTFAARTFLAGYLVLVSFKLLTATALLSAETCLLWKELTSKFEKITSSVLTFVAVTSICFSSNASGRRSSSSATSLSPSYYLPLLVS